MMKKKKIIAGLFAAAMLAAAGCGNGDVPDSTSESTAELSDAKTLTALVYYPYGDEEEQHIGEGQLGELLGFDMSKVEGCEKYADTELYHLDCALSYVAANEALEADWICFAAYSQSMGGEKLFARVVYIKDGKIVRELEPIDDYHISRMFDSCAVVSADENLYYLDLATGRKVKMNSNILVGEPQFIAESDKYLVIETDRVMVMNKEALTFINKNIFVYDHRCVLDGNNVEYILTEDGTSLVERYEGSGDTFTGWTLKVSESCSDEDIGRFINEYMTVDIELSEKNTFFSLDNGCLYSADKTKLCAVPHGVTDEHAWIVPNGAEEELDTFTVPESVDFIAEHAFYKGAVGINLDAVYVGEGVTDENAKSLDLWEGTKVYRRTASQEERDRKKILENQKYAELFNGDESEYNALIANLEGKYGPMYRREGRDIGYSRVSADIYTDLHFYIYDTAIARYVVAILPAEGDDAEFHTLGTVDGESFGYYLFPVLLDAESRYMAEAGELAGMGD